MNRNDIINELIQLIKNNSNVYAAWLEGSDANGHLDEYSDIDFCVDIDVEAIDKLFEEIKHHFEIDNAHIVSNNETERQLVFHVKGTNKFCLVDFNAYFHGLANTTFVNGDNIDVCKVLFDKCNIIKYKDYDKDEGIDARIYWKHESKYRFSQISRVEKYCMRGEYPEAFIYYNKYVIEPLVFTLRCKYTPTKVWYYMVHISRHIPKDELDKLYKILQVSNTDDILNNLKFAEKWYEKLTENE